MLALLENVSELHIRASTQEAAMKIYTIKDIARKAGVSVTTVSRVLNHRPDVNKATREKVEKVMAECHFVGNANARGLKQVDGDLVAVIVRGHQNPFLNALTEAILQRAKDLKAAFITEYIDEKADEFQTALRLLHEKRATGFIFVGSRPDERTQAIASLEMPMVFTTVNAAHTQLTHAASVSIDDRAMAREATGVLLSRGHRKIAVFGASRSDGDNLSQRYKGVKDAFMDAGLAFDESRYVETRFSLKGAYDCAREFFTEMDDTTAVFAMSDTVAMGVIRALQDMGKRVPDDVSVFGFDGTETGKYFIPRLSTVEQPVAELAEQSVLVLSDMLEHGTSPRHVVVEATLRLRESVK